MKPKKKIIGKDLIKYKCYDKTLNKDVKLT